MGSKGDWCGRWVLNQPVQPIPKTLLVLLVALRHGLLILPFDKLHLVWVRHSEFGNSLVTVEPPVRLFELLLVLVDLGLEVVKRTKSSIHSVDGVLELGGLLLGFGCSC